MNVLLAWNQLDLPQKVEVLHLAADAAGGAYLAKQRIENWLEQRRIRSRYDPRQVQ
jgi:hypothetical protein